MAVLVVLVSASEPIQVAPAAGMRKKRMLCSAPRTLTPSRPQAGRPHLTALYLPPLSSSLEIVVLVVVLAGRQPPDGGLVVEVQQVYMVLATPVRVVLPSMLEVVVMQASVVLLGLQVVAREAPERSGLPRLAEQRVLVEVVVQVALHLELTAASMVVEAVVDVMPPLRQVPEGKVSYS